MYAVIKEKFERIVAENDLLALTPEEAIGNPESEDFPILKGVERLMQAEFAGSFGQAFTDMYGDFEGTLQDVLAMELNNNYRRAIFVATLNAVWICSSFWTGTGGRGSHWSDFSRFMHGAVLSGANLRYWILMWKMLGGRSSVLSCWTAVRIRKRCCGGAIWRLLRGRRWLTGRLRRYWRLRGRRRSFMGSASRGLLSCSGSSGFVRGRREGGVLCRDFYFLADVWGVLPFFIKLLLKYYIRLM